MATSDSNLSSDDKQLNKIGETNSLGRQMAEAFGWRIEIIVYGDWNTVTQIFNPQGELADKFDSAGDSLDERWEWEVEEGETIPHYHIDLNVAIKLTVKGYYLHVYQGIDCWFAHYAPTPDNYMIHSATVHSAETPASAICKAFLAVAEYRTL